MQNQVGQKCFQSLRAVLGADIKSTDPLVYRLIKSDKSYLQTNLTFYGLQPGKIHE